MIQQFFFSIFILKKRNKSFILIYFVCDVVGVCVFTGCAVCCWLCWLTLTRYWLAGWTPLAFGRCVTQYLLRLRPLSPEGKLPLFLQPHHSIHYSFIYSFIYSNWKQTKSNWNSIQFNSNPIGIQLNSIQFYSIQIQMELNSIQFYSIQIKIHKIQLEFNSIQFYSIQIQWNSIQFNSNSNSIELPMAVAWGERGDCLDLPRLAPFQTTETDLKFLKGMWLFAYPRTTR